tara:strand:- start:32 stop:655 length:624 start_codon:yes stop_codon:yes gene_type:complete
MLDLLKKYSTIIIVLVYTYFLFFHIKDKEYMKMLGLTLVTAALICMNKSTSVEGLTNSQAEEIRHMDVLSGEEDMPILDDEYIQSQEPVKFVPFESTSRMGPYDGLCIDAEYKVVDELISNEELSTYLGVQGPLESRKSEDLATGPSVDGDEDQPIKKKAILSNNTVSLNCCDSSPFSSSNGCVCVTNKQKKFIRSRGHNKTSPDYV